MSVATHQRRLAYAERWIQYVRRYEVDALCSSIKSPVGNFHRTFLFSD